jgi:hypothetical protein
MGNQLSQLTATDTSTPTIQLPKAGPPGPKGDQGPPGPPGNPSLLLGTDDFKKAVNKSIDPDVIKPKSLDLKYSGIQDTESILKMYGVNTGTSNYYLMKGGHGEADNITIDASGNIMTKGNVDVGGTVRANGARLLGNVDQDPTGNFWLGLNGTASEPDRLAIAMIGDRTTGKVNNVTISKPTTIASDLAVNGRIWSGGAGNGGMWVDGQKGSGQFVGSYDQNSLGMYNAGDWRLLVQNDGTTKINGNLNVIKNTTLGPTVLQNSSTFKVGGKSDTFYPVIFYDNGWNNGQYRLEITRANVHTNNDWRGSMRFICEGHTTNWGHGSDSMDFYYISANDNTNKSNPESFDMFVANASNWWRASFIVIWLRGNSSYEWRSLTGMTLHDGNSEGVDKVSPKIGDSTDTWAQRKDIDGRFNLAAKYYDVGNLRNRPATRYFDSDIQIPSGRHLWIRDQYHGMTYGPDDNFPNSADGPIVFGYGGGSLGTTANGKKVAMTWDINNDVVARNSLVVSRDLAVNGQIVNSGNDFLLGKSDGGADNKGGRGNFANGMQNGRALVKYNRDNPDGTKSPILYMNWSGDYSGGVRVSGPNLSVEGDLSVDKTTNIYGQLYAVNNRVDNITNSAIQIGPDNDPGKDTNLYSLSFGGGEGKNYIGQGLISKDKKVFDKTKGNALATHIRPTTEWGIYSDGWNPLFNVEGGSGNVKIGDCLTIGSKNGGGHQLCSDGTTLTIKGAGGSSKPIKLWSGGDHSSIMTTRVNNTENWFGY